jgi:hypothetical protein
VRVAGKKGKSIQIVVDEQGIEWDNPQWWRPGWQRMLWSEVRAFYTFFYLNSSEKTTSERQQVYVLDAPAHTLVWMASFPWITNTAQQKATIERLHGLIAAYTRLPLRDLTKAADDLEIVISSIYVGLTVEQFAKATQRFALLPHPPQRINPKKRWGTAFSGLLPFLLIGIFAATAFGVQTYQSHQYEQMLANIHTHQPLFHDDLHYADGYWSTSLPDANSPGSFIYKDSSHQLTGDYFMDALAPGAYGDAEIEVTARLYSASSYDQYSDFGLLLHSDDPYTGIEFKIDTAGQWSFGPQGDEFVENGSDIQESGAIHKGFGVDNRLAVIIHSNEYICYINGQVVGIFQDARSPQGPVGLYAESNQRSPAPVMAFTDFAIYPL